ncbi:MAG: ACT domain-containing protein [Clostridia bacterium]|nr:ACT domain-containing protein [Clostridia bacterium]
MQLRKLPYRLTVAKYEKVPEGLTGFFSLSSAVGEISLVAETDLLPTGYIVREDGWRAIMVEGQLDFSLVGVLSELSGILAAAEIPLFALSTYNTDYLLVKERDLERAASALAEKGHIFL